MDSKKTEQADLNTNGNNVVLMLDSNDNDSMLSLKDLLYAVLRNLGIVLIAAVLLGGALFAYKITSKKVAISEKVDFTAKKATESDFEYQTRIKKIDRARDIVNAMDRVNYQIEHQRNYLAESVYMQIDPENVYESKSQFVITLNDNLTSGVDRALISAYQNAVWSGDYLDEYAAKWISFSNASSKVVAPY